MKWLAAGMFLMSIQSGSTAHRIGPAPFFFAVSDTGRSAEARNTTPRIDPKAVWLLESAAAKLRNASTLQAVTEENAYTWPQYPTRRNVRVDTIRYRRSGGLYMRRQETDWDAGGSNDLIVADAQSCVRSFQEIQPDADHKPSQFMQSLLHTLQDAGVLMKTSLTHCDPTGATENFDGNWLLHAFHPQPPGRPLNIAEWDTDRLHDPLVRSVTYEGETRWNGVVYDVVQWVYEQSYVMPEMQAVYTTRVFIDADQVVRRIVTTSTKGPHWDISILSLTLNAPIADEELRWSPPANAEITEPKPLPSVTKNVGQTIPAFTGGRLADGSTVTSAQLLSGHRATLVWFWNTGCSSCCAHMPHMEQLYEELRGQGIQMVAVNILPFTSSELERTRTFQRFHHIAMPIVFNAKPWGTWLDSTSWFAVVDPQGKVIAHAEDTLNYATIRALLRRVADDTSGIKPSATKLSATQTFYIKSQSEDAAARR